MESRLPWLLGASLVLVALSTAAPAHCRACLKNCPVASPNSTDVDVSSNSTDTLIDDIQTNEIHRSKRASGVYVAPCQSSFPIEVLLIPLGVAIIPLVLCSLLLWVCCCGPQESRATKPDISAADVMETVRKYSYAARKKSQQETTEDMELEYRDGYVQRKDSKLMFSTTVSYIEPPRRQSIWSMSTLSEPPSVPTSPIRKTASTESFKKTRFSETVQVCDDAPPS